MTAAQRITRQQAADRFAAGETIGYAHTHNAREVEMWITEGVGTQPSFGYLLRTLEARNTQLSERGQARRLYYWYMPVERASDDMQREAVDAIRTIVSRRSGSLSPSNTLIRVQAVLDRFTEQENHQ